MLQCFISCPLFKPTQMKIGKEQFLMEEKWLPLNTNTKAILLLILGFTVKPSKLRYSSKPKVTTQPTAQIICEKLFLWSKNYGRWHLYFILLKILRLIFEAQVGYVPVHF